MAINNKPFFAIMLTEQNDDGTADTVTEVPLDVRQASTYRFQATVTENPVEDGSSINDHIVIKPDVVTCEGFVSNTPVTVASGTPNKTQVQTKGNVSKGLSTSAPQGAYDLMETIFRGKKIVTIVCEYTLFDDMVIESWEVPRSKDRGGNDLWFSATFKKIVTVETLTAQLPPDVVAKLKRRRAKKKVKSSSVTKYTAQKAKVIEEGKKTKTTTDTKTKTAAKSPVTAGTTALKRTK